MVTEHGFVNQKITFSQQVDDLINEMEESGMISHIYPEKRNCDSKNSDETR